MNPFRRNQFPTTTLTIAIAAVLAAPAQYSLAQPKLEEVVVKCLIGSVFFGQ